MVVVMRVDGFLTRVVSFREVPDFIKAVDRRAKRLGIDRSTFIRIGMRLLMDMSDSELRGIIRAYEPVMWRDFNRYEKRKDRPTFFID